MVFRSLLLVGGIAVSVALLGPLAGEAVQQLASEVPAPVSAAPAATALSESPPIGITTDGNGHYRVTAMVNGGTVMMVVDTGAGMVVLTENDARQVGLTLNPSQFTGHARTAAGEVAVAPIIIERISVAGVERRGVRGVVAQGSALPTSLLGQSFLSTLHEVRITDGVMTLRP
ncbi:MAG: TIGR02281 family clan AA aspartic protease [Sphingopyxis sp.]